MLDRAQPERKYRSRDDRPDSPKIERLTPRQQDMLRLHDPFGSGYRYLSPPFYGAFLGISEHVARHYITQLNSKHNRYLRQADKTKGQKNSYLWWELDERGKDFLGRPSGKYLEYNQQWAHRIGIDSTTASMEIGARQHGVRRLSATQVYERDKFNNKDAEKPFSIPVIIEWPTKNGVIEYAYDYTPDDINVWLYANDTGLCTVSEYERTTDADSKDVRKTSYRKKFKAMQYIMAHKLYMSYWGVPNLLNLTTGSRAKIERCKEIVLEETNGKGCSWALFQEVASVANYGERVMPRPELFGKWERVGYPDFDFTKWAK